MAQYLNMIGPVIDICPSFVSCDFELGTNVSESTVNFVHG